MGRYVSWMRVATLLRAPAAHSASSFALAALSLKGVKSATMGFCFTSASLPTWVSHCMVRVHSGTVEIQRTLSNGKELTFDGGPGVLRYRYLDQKGPDMFCDLSWG